MRSVCRSLPLVAGLALAALAGCERDEIRTYDVPRPDPRTRLLAALLPHDETTWVFKLEGPAGAVDEQAAAFDALVKSVKVKRPATPPIAWDLPAGWTREGGKDLRHATLKTDTLPPLEVAVFKFGKEAGSVLDNVNRWRGQLGLKPIADAELAQHVETLPVEGDLAATRVNLVGFKSQAKKAADPMAGPKLPDPPRGADGGEKFTFTRPPGWEDLKSNSAFRKASLQVAEGGQKAEVTVIPLSGRSGTLLENVDRWRGEVGLEPLRDEAKLAGAVKTIDVGGAPAQYVDLAGKEKRTLGALLKRGDTTWFFKMTGPPELLEKQKGNFEKFVASARFGADQGAQP